MRHLYKSEDLLFNVLFDRKYRHDLQSEVLTAVSSNQSDGQKSLRKSLYNVEIGGLASEYRSLSHFAELDYIESMTKTNIQLIYKYPLIFCLCGTWYYKKRVVQAHAELLKKSFYLRIDTP